MKRLVAVNFDGFVEVTMPDGLTDEQADELAYGYALSHVLATVEDPDKEVSKEPLKDGQEIWEKCSGRVASGTWSSHPHEVYS